MHLYAFAEVLSLISTEGFFIILNHVIVPNTSICPVYVASFNPSFKVLMLG